MRIAAVVCAALLVVSSSGAQAAEPKRWALVIGIDDYVGLVDLRYCGGDASALAESLKSSGFDERQLVVMHDKASEIRYRPSKRNIEKELDILLALAGPDDLVIVFFAGHGMHLDGKSYLCPSEADDTDPAATMIAVDDVYKKFDKCPATLKLMLVDACRNDPRPPGKRSATPKADLLKLGASFETPPKGIIVLASCAPGQISWEDDELKHGVFMHYFLRGLSGEADGDKNGRITLSELYDFTSNETKLHVARRFRDIQVPAQKGEINGVFELPRAGMGKEFGNTIGMKLALIPAGEFQMGSGAADTDAQADEKPRHRVRITKPFYLGVHEVTRGQFAQFVQAVSYRTEAERDGEGGYGYDEATNQFEKKPEYTWRDTGWPQTDDHPVVNVSWNDAQAFCAWLSKKEGKSYRLPTEAEWEYACRAGTTTKYSHGDDPEGLATIGNVADRSINLKKPAEIDWGIESNDGYVFSSPVGKFLPNRFGLYDMTGNVWEWCSDWYGEKYYGETTSSDPSGPGTGSLRVLRGGGWYDSPEYCRSADRSGNTPVIRHIDLGFRVALVP